MAGKPKRMSQIKQLLLLHKQGKSKKAIARDLELSKNTVKNYLTKLEINNLDINELLALEDPVLEGVFFAGNPAVKDFRYETLKNNLDYYAREINKVGVTYRILWDEYKENTKNHYRYTQFCFHLNQHLKRTNPTMVLHHNPGEKLFIDFAGKKLVYYDRKTGEEIECEVFVACLPYSDYGFAMAVPSQRIEDFIYALSCCLQEIGGVPLALVPDNLKSAVIKSSRYEPQINRVLEDFANHYQTTVCPARARRPRDKALVENQVKIIYSRVYAKIRNTIFTSLAEMNETIFGLMRNHNQTRMQQKECCREEIFLAEEKLLLKSLPNEPFEIKHYKTLTVAKNNHIYLLPDKHYYSVPYSYIGQKVTVILTRKLVSIYAKNQCIATHYRNYVKGRYTTEPTHLCSQHQHQLQRSGEYYIQRAAKCTKTFHQLVEKIFNQDRYPETLYRTCDGLFSLQKKSNPDDFEKACRMALTVENYSYSFLINVLQNKTFNLLPENPPTPLPDHKNTRGASYYN